jgi:undecaprenyl-diphosphatase
MQYSVFMFYNALGGIVWAVLFGSLGYAFGRNLPVLEHYVGQASMAFVLLAALVVLLALMWRRYGASGSTVWEHAQGAWIRCRESSLGRRIGRKFPRAWRFVTVRSTPGEYLGLHLTVGLLISLGSLWLFGTVTEDVLHHDPLTAFDTTLLASLRAHATPAGDRIAIIVSLVGSPGAMAILAAFGAIYLAMRREWLSLGGWLSAFVGAMLLTEALKRIVQRPRPDGAASFLHGASYSFPSGHTLGSLVGYGMLAYFVLTESRRTNTTRTTWMLLATSLLIVAIAVSRLYLGVHYFSDVIGGLAAGSLWLSACVSGMGVVRGRQTTTRPEVSPERVDSPIDA